MQKTCGGKFVCGKILTRFLQTNDFVKLIALGFSVDQNMLQLGMIKMQYKDIKILGAIGNKSISISCNMIDESLCVQVSNDVFELINKCLNSI